MNLLPERTQASTSIQLFSSFNISFPKFDFFPLRNRKLIHFQIRIQMCSLIGFQHRIGSIDFPLTLFWFLLFFFYFGRWKTREQLGEYRKTKPFWVWSANVNGRTSRRLVLFALCSGRNISRTQQAILIRLLLLFFFFLPSSFYWPFCCSLRLMLPLNFLFNDELNDSRIRTRYWYNKCSLLCYCLFFFFPPCEP